MSRERARNDDRWSKKSKRQICEDRGWIFKFVESGQNGPGWYADDQYNISGGLFELFEFSREFDYQWHSGWGDHKTNTSKMDDPRGPYESLEIAIETIYRVEGLYKGYPENYVWRKTFATARHSELRRRMRKEVKSSERFQARRQMLRVSGLDVDEFEGGRGEASDDPEINSPSPT